MCLTPEEVQQIEAAEPKQSKKLFNQYIYEKYTLKQLAESNGMKLHQIQKYSKRYKYVARKKFYSQNRNSFNHHKNTMDFYFKICPECNSCELLFDDIHYETYCKKCGLVIISPPTTDFVTDGYKYLYIHSNFSNIPIVLE